ncbi:MAG: HAMP domain-containing sensor histidine kinase [Nitrospiraceae bacterium]|nr:HAMP domain-containing sensor histidine kinase [Nitrospiraceae bacterium]
MRSKLFFAFFLVIALALFSNFFFGEKIMSDFAAYEKGTREDHIYWLLDSVENGYRYDEGRWNMKTLDDSLQWAAMLRLDCRVEDKSGRLIASSSQVVSRLSEEMQRKMQIMGLSGEGPYERYPLFRMGRQIGFLAVRDIQTGNSVVRRKERAFKERGRQFLILSFAIAGGGALFLAVVFSQFLSRPVRELKDASEALARGNLTVRLGGTGPDEIGRLKAAFNAMAEALQREDSLRKQLTANVAHELRTPLAIMKANIEAMLDGVIEADRQGLEALRAELDSLTRLIGGIEDLTKAEASFFKKNPPEEVLLREFLEGIVLGMMPLFTDRGLALELAPEREFAVFTEPEKLEKVLRNLLVNARNHTRQGGVALRYGRERAMFYVEVEDTGEGMSPDELDRIFDRFYKGKDSKGFGLGLAIARQLVEIMGGNISVKSAPGEGSVFRVSLPSRAQVER